MINANELRIGNFIHVIDKVEPVEVITIKKHHVKDGDMFTVNGYIQEHISGIIPDRILLLSMGFKPNDFKRNLYHYKNFCYNIKSKTIQTSKSSSMSSQYIKHVYSIHDISNVIFALTGQELKINL